MDTHEQSADVLIVGAGPVGLTLACELVRHGASCRIIDAAASPSTTSKALAIFPRTLEVFATMGMVDAILAAGHTFHSLTLQAEGRQLAQVRFDDIDSPYAFVLSLPQSVTECLLTRHLATFGVTVERGTEFVALRREEACVIERGTEFVTLRREDTDVTIRLRHADGHEETTSVKWLIGCDGAHSVVRQALGLPFAGAQYEETLVLADVTLAGALPDDEATIFLHQDGLLALFPFGQERYRIVADVSSDSAAACDAEPTFTDIQTLVTQRGPTGIALRDATWLSRFHISRRKVAHYRQGRVFLAEDAAHIHSPVGGQGMNTGIQDAYNLAWKLALVAARRSPALLLDSYDAEREPVARKVLELTDKLTEIATLRRPLVQQARNVLLSVLADIGPLQHRMANVMAELVVNYRHSPIVAQHWDGAFAQFFHTGLAAGDRAPDGDLVEAGTNTSTRLFQVFRDTRHTLLLFGGDAPTSADVHSLVNIEQMVRDTYDRHIAVHHIIAGDTVPSDVPWNSVPLLDVERMVHRRYDASAPCLYLIRPDGYIGFRSRPPMRVDLDAYAQRLFLRH